MAQKIDRKTKSGAVAILRCAADLAASGRVRDTPLAAAGAELEASRSELDLAAWAYRQNWSDKLWASKDGRVVMFLDAAQQLEDGVSP